MRKLYRDHLLVFRKKFRNTTNKADPRTAHSIGNGCSPNLIHGKRGRSSSLAIKVPIKAPIKPKTIDARQPMFFRPAILAPMDPVMEAMISIKTKEKKLILIPLKSMLHPTIHK